MSSCFFVLYYLSADRCMSGSVLLGCLVTTMLSDIDYEEHLLNNLFWWIKNHNTVIYTVIHKKLWQYICYHNSRKSWWILISLTYLGNGNECPLRVSYLLIYFTCDVNMASLSRLWHWWGATASAACVARLGAVSDWWCSWSMTDTLACLCSRQWWTFWAYLVTVSLFSLYLMNFVSHHAWCSR